MKRFYAAVTVDAAAGGFCILLDGRHVRTPAGAPLTLPARLLAEAIAGEWAAQDDQVRLDTMALMRLAATAVDRVLPAPGAVIDQIAAYAATDLVCYRAEAPAELVTRQSAAWQPMVDWAADALHAPLTVTAGVVPVAQPQAALSAVREAVARHSPMALAALQLATAASGSVVIALALADGFLDAASAARASQIDETFQAERWGEDVEAAKRRSALKDDIAAAGRFLDLAR